MLKHLRQLATESVVYGLSGVLSRFLTIFLVPLYTLALTPADYGTMSLIRNTAVLLGTCASLALDSAAGRFYWDSEDPVSRKSALACWAWCYLTTTSLVAVAVIVFADNLSVKLVGTGAAAASLRLAGVTLPLNVLGLVFMNRLRWQRRPWGVTAYALATSVITIVLTAVLVLRMHRGVEGVFLAQFVMSLATTVCLIALVRDWIHPRYFELNRLKAMVRYALPLVPTVIGLWVVDVIDRYFLQVYASTTQVGLYEIGYSIAAIVALGTGAFQQAWIPFAMSIQAAPEAKQVYANTLIAYAWVGCLGCAGAAIFAPEVLRLLTTKAYYGADSVVACLAFSYLLMGAGNIAALGAAVTKKTVSLGIAVIGSAFGNIALNFLLVPSYGKDGAAWATLLSSTVVPAYLFYRSQKLYPIPYRFGKPILITAFALVIVKIGTNLSLDSLWLAIAGKAVLLSLFLPLLLLLRIVSIGDVRALMQGRVAWSPGVAVPERR